MVEGAESDGGEFVAQQVSSSCSLLMATVVLARSVIVVEAVGEGCCAPGPQASGRLGRDVPSQRRVPGAAPWRGVRIPLAHSGVGAAYPLVVALASARTALRSECVIPRDFPSGLLAVITAMVRRNM